MEFQKNLQTFNESELTPILKKLRSHLVLLVNKETQENGSGVLIEIEKHVFVITAAHVITPNIHINLGLPVQQSPFSIIKMWVDKELDIGFIELNPFEVSIFRHDEAFPYKINTKTNITIEEKMTTLTLVGYPWSYKKNGEKFVAFIPAFIGCALISEKNWPESLHNNGKTGEKNFAIPYGQKHNGLFYDNNKNPILPIDPHGMSGCGLWYFNHESALSDNPTYSLVGIQNSLFPQSQIVTGTFLDPIINAICNQYNFSLYKPRTTH